MEKWEVIRWFKLNGGAGGGPPSERASKRIDAVDGETEKIKAIVALLKRRARPPRAMIRIALEAIGEPDPTPRAPTRAEMNELAAEERQKRIERKKRRAS